MRVNRCPSEETLSELLGDRLPSGPRVRLEAHVDGCRACQAALDRITRTEAGTAVERLRRAVRPGADPKSEFGAQLRALAGRPAPEPARPRVAGYELLGELGRGGTAVVYRARHLGLNRLVALKMLRGGAAQPLRDRLRQEARTLARLSHPNIVQVYDIGEQDGWPFFSLELVEGVTLARWTGGAPQPPRTAAEVVLTVARAVECAHQNGILHRDLKPSNILLGPADPDARRPVTPATPLEALRLKVTDFGLAAAVGGDPLTETGAVLGTPSYMAPEQARAGAPVTPRADVYALGAVLYELLTGRPPFRAHGPLQTLLQVVHDDPVPVLRAQPRLPRDLATICTKCLEKEPARRYARAADLADDLGRFLAHEPIRARPVGALGQGARWARRRPGRAGLVLIASAALTAGSALVFWQWSAAEEARRRAERLAAAESVATAAARDQRDAAEGARRATERASAELVLDRGLELCERGEVDAGLSELALGLERVTGAGLDDLGPVFRANLAAWGARRLVPGESPPLGASVTAVAFRPDGKRVVTGQWANAFAKPGPGIAQVWDPVGWRPVGPPLAHTGPVGAVAYSPDGTRIVTGALDGTVQVWDADSGRPLGSPIRELQSVRTVAYHPNGRSFAAGGAARGADASGAVGVWGATTGEPAFPVIAHPGPVLALVFSPDGRTLATGCGTGAGANRGSGGEARFWDAATGRPDGPVLMHSAPVRAVAFSPNGKVLLTGGDDKTTLLWERGTGQRLGPPHTHPYMVHCAAFAPDGKTVLVGGGDARRAGGGNDGAGLWDALTGKPCSAPLAHPDVVHAAALRPDGRQVVTGCRDGRLRLWELGDLRPAVELLTPHPLSAVAFSPDGRRLVSGAESGTGGAVRVWDLGSGRAIGAPGAHPGRVETVALAPDGRTYATGCADGVRVWETGTGRALGPRLPHSGPVEALTFAPDGRALLALAPGREAKLWAVGTGRAIWESAPGDPPPESAVLSADGRTLAVGGTDGLVRLRNTATGRIVTEFAASPHRVQVALSPDGYKILTGGAAGAARLWDAATGRALGPPLEHTGDTIWALGFTADSDRVFTVAGTPYRDRGAVRLWNPITGRLQSRLPHQVTVRAVTLDPTRRFLMTAGWEGDVRLWEVGTGRPVGPRWPGGGLVHALAFAPDGRTIAAAGEDGVLRAWPVPVPVAPPVPERVR